MAPSFNRKPVGQRLLLQRRPDDLANGLGQVGRTLEGVEQCRLVDLRVGLDQAAAEFGEAGEFSSDLQVWHINLLSGSICTYNNVY
jgi:hypothetical protein